MSINNEVRYQNNQRILKYTLKTKESLRKLFYEMSPIEFRHMDKIMLPKSASIKARSHFFRNPVAFVSLLQHTTNDILLLGCFCQCYVWSDNR